MSGGKIYPLFYLPIYLREKYWGLEELVIGCGDFPSSLICGFLERSLVTMFVNSHECLNVQKNNNSGCLGENLFGAVILCDSIFTPYNVVLGSVSLSLL